MFLKRYFFWALMLAIFSLTLPSCTEKENPLTIFDYTGQFNFINTCEENNYVFEISIIKMPSSERDLFLTIENDIGIFATVDNMDVSILDIELQLIDDDEYIFGTGILTKDEQNVITLTMDIVFTDEEGFSFESCQLIGTKQQ